MRNTKSSTRIRQGPLRATLAVLAALLVMVAVACETPSGTARPSPSLVDLEFTFQPGTFEPSAAPTDSEPTPVAGVWPVGWDVAFCTALTDAVVTHELVIDIQRAIEDDSREDAALLTIELSETVPIAAAAVTRNRDWTPALEVKANLIAMLELHAATATAYQTWFDEGGRQLLRAARQTRAEVARAVPAANENLQGLADLGLTCPGTSLALEEF